MNITKNIWFFIIIINYYYQFSNDNMLHIENVVIQEKKSTNVNKTFLIAVSMSILSFIGYKVYNSIKGNQTLQIKKEMTSNLKITPILNQQNQLSQQKMEEFLPEQMDARQKKQQFPMTQPTIRNGTNQRSNQLEQNQRNFPVTSKLKDGKTTIMRTATDQMNAVNQENLTEDPKGQREEDKEKGDMAGRHVTGGNKVDIVEAPGAGTIGQDLQTAVGGGLLVHKAGEIDTDQQDLQMIGADTLQDQALAGEAFVQEKAAEKAAGTAAFAQEKEGLDQEKVGFAQEKGDLVQGQRAVTVPRGETLTAIVGQEGTMVGAPGINQRGAATGNALNVGVTTAHLDRGLVTPLADSKNPIPQEKIDQEVILLQQLIPTIKNKFSEIGLLSSLFTCKDDGKGNEDNKTKVIVSIIDHSLRLFFNIGGKGGDRTLVENQKLYAQLIFYIFCDIFHGTGKEKIIINELFAKNRVLLTIDQKMKQVLSDIYVHEYHHHLIGKREDNKKILSEIQGFDNKKWSVFFFDLLKIFDIFAFVEKNEKNNNVGSVKNEQALITAVNTYYTNHLNKYNTKHRINDNGDGFVGRFFNDISKDAKFGELLLALFKEDATFFDSLLTGLCIKTLAEVK